MSDALFDPAEYPDALAEFLKATDGLFGFLSSFTWEPNEDAPADVPVLETVVRAVFCRQHEALSAIPKLRDVDRGYLGALLVRAGPSPRARGTAQDF